MMMALNHVFSKHQMVYCKLLITRLFKWNVSKISIYMVKRASKCWFFFSLWFIHDSFFSSFDTIWILDGVNCPFVNSLRLKIYTKLHHFSIEDYLIQSPVDLNSIPNDQILQNIQQKQTKFTQDSLLFIKKTRREVLMSSIHFHRQWTSNKNAEFKVGGLAIVGGVCCGFEWLIDRCRCRTSNDQSTITFD